MLKSAKNNDERKTYTALLKAAEQRCKEQEQGAYDFPSLFRKGADGELDGVAVKFDVAEYIGPVKEAVVEGKGRALVAARDIAPGELLMVVKAEDIVGHAEVSVPM
jgi:hypothetical protein